MHFWGTNWRQAAREGREGLGMGVGTGTRTLWHFLAPAWSQEWNKWAQDVSEDGDEQGWDLTQLPALHRR